LERIIMKKAIIFGVTGQDGSHLLDLLLSKGYEVIGVARRCSVDTSERIKNRLECPHFNLVHGDITDASSVMNILRNNEDVDEIYNLAAQSHVGVSFKQPGLTWDITGKGCFNILQSIVDLGMFGSRFYQASSSEMFGDSYDIDKDGEKVQNENTKFLPQSPYAIAKCAAHYAVRLFREAYGLHASAGILFNHEGERRGETFVTRKITKWIGDWHKTGYDKNFPKLRLGNLEAFRDWGYAGDYVRAMWLMLQQEQPDDYVICTGKTHTIREFLDCAFGHIGIEDWEEHVVIDPEFYRPAEVDYLRGDCSKAKEKLEWEPECNLEDLVKIMVEHDVNANI
tara:strand:+ start:3054 stop:4070 length:1017 start_codon:yes stop_codon:yes gene_type:complete